MLDLTGQHDDQHFDFLGLFVSEVGHKNRQVDGLLARSEGVEACSREMVRGPEGLVEGADEEDVVNGGEEVGRGGLFLVVRGAEEEVRFVEFPAAPIARRFVEDGQLGGAGSGSEDGGAEGWAGGGGEVRDDGALGEVEQTLGRRGPRKVRLLGRRAWMMVGRSGVACGCQAAAETGEALFGVAGEA